MSIAVLVAASKKDRQLRGELKRTTQHADTLESDVNSAKETVVTMPFYETRVNELVVEVLLPLENGDYGNYQAYPSILALVLALDNKGATNTIM